MIKNIKDIIKRTTEQRHAYNDVAICSCNNKNLFNIYNSCKSSIYICDNCNIKIIVKIDN